jgi:hypothetical protein
VSLIQRRNHVKKTSLEIPQGIQEKIPTSPAKEGYLGAVKFFNDLTQYALGSDEFPHSPYIEGSSSHSHSVNGVRNLLQLVRSSTRMTGFMKDYKQRPTIEVTVYHDKVVVAKFAAIFWHGGRIARMEMLREWDTYSGGQFLKYLGGREFLLVD